MSDYKVISKTMQKPNVVSLRKKKTFLSDMGFENCYKGMHIEAKKNPKEIDIEICSPVAQLIRLRKRFFF